MVVVLLITVNQVHQQLVQLQMLKNQIVVVQTHRVRQLIQALQHQRAINYQIQPVPKIMHQVIMKQAMVQKRQAVVRQVLIQIVVIKLMVQIVNLQAAHLQLVKAQAEQQVLLQMA